ncbi:VOC family protein [Streptomyces sp. NPDC059479]|uniref:VOC family protein n=1 Tax=Streptomyces sp. NPDC059479 TaxID=3346848 RepID=UPI00368B84E2
MHVHELGHVVLFVKNLERSAHFYRDILGFRALETPARMKGAVMAFSTGRTHHEMLLIEVGEQAMHPGNGRRAGLYHIGLKVGDTDEELLSAWRELERAGVAVSGMADHTVTHSLYLADPDGNEIELYIDVPGTDWSDVDQVLAATRPLRL